MVCSVPEEFDDQILVVEDDADIAFLVSRALAHLSPKCEVVHLHDGDDAIRWLEVHPKPALLVTDLEMPRVTDVELLEWIRLQPDARFPVVVFSGSHSPQYRRRCAELEVDDFLEKDGSLSSLTRRCQDLLHAKRVPSRIR